MHRPWLSLVLRLVMLASVAFGAVRSAGVAWNLGDLGDLGVGLMA